MKKVNAVLAAAAIGFAALFSACKAAEAEVQASKSVASSVSVQSASSSSSGEVSKTGKNAKRVTGYFCEWGIYGAHGNYFPQHIPYEKLTHINYAFVGLNPSTQAVDIYDSWATSEIVNDGEKWDTEYKGCLGLLRKYKAKYPHVKVLVSVGGWTKSHGFHAAAATADSRERAAKNLVDFVVANGMDGVDIDWEYPGVNRDKDGNDQFDMGAPGGIEDKENFTLFLKAIRQALDAQGAKDGKYYELTAAIGVGYDKIAVTNPGEYSKYLDALNLMAYDMHGAFEATTGHQAPLYANPAHDNNPSAEIVEKYNIDWAVEEFLRQGVPASKIVIGLPFYSRGWNDVKGGWDVDGNGTPDGMFGTGGSSLAGTWGVGGQSPYYEVKALEGTSGWEKFRDPISKACWLYNRSKGELYTYDDIETIQTKCNYILDKDLGGAMYWELDGDTWKDGSNELINIIADAMFNGDVPAIDISKPVVDPSDKPSQDGDKPSQDKPADSGDVTVPEVTDGGKVTGKPGNISLEQTTWNGEATFGLRMNMWWGQNGTVLELLENGKTVQAVALTDNSPSAQSYTFTVENKANGTYEYQAKLTNKFGSSESTVVKYTVTKGSNAPAVQDPVEDPKDEPVDTPVEDPKEEPKEDPKDEPVDTPVIGGDPIEVQGLPTYVLTGYWQNFNNGAKVLRISDVPAAYDIICVSFGESTSVPGEVVFNLDSSLGFSKAQFIADIRTAKARGQHVILSVGGETGNVLINSDAAAAKFASSITALMNEYGFEGVDIDLEHGINSTYIAKALRGIPAGSIITFAPQTLDMQSTGMEYFKLALEVKDILTINNMQYYNSGSMLGYDGKVYSQGNENFLTALATIQLENGLRPDQCGLGLPASTRGAGSGYVDPQIIINAMDTLVTGAKHGSYVPPHKYPTFRGVMTWSINWDASNNWYFADSIGAYLAKLNGKEYVKAGTSSSVTEPSDPVNPGNPSGPSNPSNPSDEKATGAPAAPSIEQTVWGGSATFGIKMNMWWGNNGTKAELLENGNVVQTVSLTDNSPSAQSHTFNVTKSANGTYRYEVRLSNSKGSTMSNAVNYTVTQAAAGSTEPVNPPAVTDPVEDPKDDPIDNPKDDTPIITDPELPEGPVNTTLPKRIMSGYWHTWDGGTPFIPLAQVDSSWDVINVSFAEPVTPGSGNGNMKFAVADKNGYSLAQFKKDVKTLHAKGKKVVLSIGGYEGYFYLADANAVSTFVSQINALVDEYGFDGIDIDLEQSSIAMDSGNDPDFRNPKTPRIRNMISAVRQICDAHGDDFILSWAPETFYVQLGHMYYGGKNGYVDSRAGGYLPMIYALRDKTTYVQVQLYNSAPIVGRDGVYYNMGTTEGIVEMCNMLLEGFTVNNDASMVFPALRADQVVIAVPCSSGAAGSGQISNAGLQAAFRQIEAKHPGLRGIMTWSINWDAFQNSNSFGRENRAFLNGMN